MKHPGSRHDGHNHEAPSLRHLLRILPPCLSLAILRSNRLKQLEAGKAVGCREEKGGESPEGGGAEAAEGCCGPGGKGAEGLCSPSCCNEGGGRGQVGRAPCGLYEMGGVGLVELTNSAKVAGRPAEESEEIVPLLERR
jgi:hypothetical protein